MAVMLDVSGAVCRAHSWPVHGAKRVAPPQRPAPPSPDRVRRCARVCITAARNDDGYNSGSRNRIGRSMDDNASTDEPWWKMWLPGQRQARPTQGKKRAGNSLSGKYHAGRSAGAGKSGTVGRPTSGRDAAGRTGKVQPTSPKASRGGGGTADAKRTSPSRFPPSRSSSMAPSYDSTPAYDGSVVDADSWMLFNNIPTDWQDSHDDEAEHCEDASGEKEIPGTDNRTTKEDGSWSEGPAGASPVSDDARASDMNTSADANESSSGSFVDVSASRQAKSIDDSATSATSSGSHSSQDTSSHISQDTSSSHSSGWDSASSHHSHDTSTYDTSSYDASSYDAGSCDSGGGDSGGGGDGGGGD